MQFFFTVIFDLVYLGIAMPTCTLLKGRICAQSTTASWLLEPFGEFSANFSLQLLLQTQLTKKQKNNQCGKL